ncbi:protein Shroom3 isoform X2 [Amphiprion ocellaris]|uniref:PDZ domain-containing protein n=1 Tax=Amphiprion ocellaris TaxID=80972 RepID=A0AAQ5XX79_AMPOC|nr:protein Shroom3 isoform X2 [Amphiprion ocellaris]
MESGGRAGLQHQRRRAAGGGGEGGGWVLVEARLQGGAPWGFTLQGGLEHGEPLIISKVEEGGKADRLEQPLLVGDEIIVINDVELTGYRQEAIALVKGSYKTLQLTVRREFDPGYIEEFVTSPPSLPDVPPPSPPPLSSPLSPTTTQQQQQTSSNHSRPCSAVQLRIKNSASTTDLSGGFDSGYLRKSPDQYSSRGSMESLDPPQSSQLHSGPQHQHQLGHHGHGGSHQTYSSCHQLSSARSSNSIDHLHSKRDSAYSSFSTSSSIPEYLASTPSFSPERSYSLETVPQRGGGSGEMQQADIRYIRTVYDAQQGLSQEHELNSTSAAMLRSTDSRGGARPGMNRDLQGSVGGVCYRGSSSGSSSTSSSSSSGGGGAPASNRHSVGPIWGLAASRSSYESLKGAPAPPRRSDSYAATRNHERPNSWSSLDHARSLRSLQKGSWHHSSGPVASAKGSYGAEGQLHTVIEKSPESSPTTKPRQGGGFPQPPSPTGASSAGSPPQSTRLILPTGVYPVPQPEPHYAQMPSSSPGPSGVYPALAKESSRQQQQQQGLQGVAGRDDGTAEGRRDGRMSAMENGYQNSTSSSHQLSSYSASASTQLRTQAHEADRHQHEESNFGPYRPPMKTTGGGSDGQTVAQRPQSHQVAYNQSESRIHTSKGPHSQVYPDQNQDFHLLMQSTPDLRPLSSQGRSDPYPPGHSWGDRSRSMDQSSVHSEPVTSPRLAQGQVHPSHLPVHAQPQAPPTSASQSSPRHFSDSAALQYQQWDHREQDKDREHPLTRLEIALAEVQRCASPESTISGSSHGNSSCSDVTQRPARSLSVLEKVSRFECRERAGKQRSHSTTNPHNKATHLRMTDKGRSTPCGAEDLRNMLERSTKGTKAHRTMSYRGGSSEHMKYRTPADPSSALQRSRSTFQLDGSREGDSSKDFPWRQEIQEILVPMQDTSSNRSYRDSLKDAQSHVLQSISFRRRDLSSSGSSPPPAAPPTVLSTTSHQPPPVPAKYHSLEKKGPKTMPKPQGIVITPQAQPSVTSPHAPKERHVVSPDVRGPDPPALPSVPPVGPPALMRICGRKRLTADQKKRSYSEPENMNEVGVSDPETAALFRRGGETSVADRRKMFELVASRVGGVAPQNPTPRPDLRQVQQDALAEYVERKRGVKREEGGSRSGSRPRSAYIQPDNGNHTASSCYSDTLSLSSTSSMLSLQDSGLDRSFSSGERRTSSTLPPGSDLRSFQSNLFYPGRVTTPRLPVQPPPSSPPGSIFELQTQIQQDLTHEAGISRRSQSSTRDPRPDHERQVAEPQISLGLSKQLNGALQRAGSARRSGKSASAEDLLEQAKDRQISPQHSRSRSSPTAEILNQDFLPGDVRMFGVFISEPGRCVLAADRPADVHVSAVSPQTSQNSVNVFQPAGASIDPGSSQTPVTRRDRQRNSERQRVHSASTLAASVGLPCPFSSPGAQDGAEWPVGEKLSRANLDAISFPEIPGPDGRSSADNKETQTRHSMSDAYMLEESPKDVRRSRAFSLEATGGFSAEDVTPLPHFQLDRRSSGSSPPPPASHPSVRQHLSSLRISESNLCSSVDLQQPPEASKGFQLEDFDEVFLQNPSEIKETNIIEDFPPPPPPVELEPEDEQPIEESPTSELLNNSPRRSSPQPVTSSICPPPPLKPQPSSITSITTSSTIEDNLNLDYQPLLKREKTSEELRVEALARQLVLQDPSMLPLLDTWGGKSTVELMEDIFPNSKLISKSQRRGSTQLEDRIPDGVCDPSQSSDRGKETDLDEDEKDVNTRKVELCEALRSSVAALQREKEALSDELRHHRVLEANIETLVQEKLKTNERDKYSMFIGDLEKIVNLLLSLCSRMSRIDRSLLVLQRDELTVEDAAEEKENLLHKRSLLLRQTDDARELKENLDRRQRVVQSILSGYLSDSQLQDYRRFVSAKPSLLIRQRHLDNLIRQGEEQLTRLAETLPPELAEAHGWSAAFPIPTLCSSPFPSLLPPSLIPGPALPVRTTTVTSL